MLGNLFLAIGGFVLACFAVFAILCIAARIYLGFELFCEREREPQPRDDELGDIPNLEGFTVWAVPHRGFKHTHTTRNTGTEG